MAETRRMSEGKVSLVEAEWPSNKTSKRRRAQNEVNLLTENKRNKQQRQSLVVPCEAKTFKQQNFSAPPTPALSAVPDALPTSSASVHNSLLSVFTESADSSAISPSSFESPQCLLQHQHQRPQGSPDSVVLHTKQSPSPSSSSAASSKPNFFGVAAPTGESEDRQTLTLSFSTQNRVRLHIRSPERPVKDGDFERTF
eukprot:gb/GEZN01019430.1/.p1 GENE.gb/GEZN01019430.1/~~gb/GEZN01019430.1/.p1  ORF type:complete len:207 (-),score=44.25 gb/GEZN01019430.1/:99-692(-)